MKAVYKAINAVQSDLAKIGISKDSRNTAQGFNFRGIDAFYNTLAPLLSSHGLCILPSVKSRTVTERATKGGGIMFGVVVEMEFTFVAAEDGSLHTVSTFGEASDSGDKGTNKAMSAAYKYACMQTFCIPTAGDNDADAHSPEFVQTMPAEELSLYQQVCLMMSEKKVSKEEAINWCNTAGVAKISEMNEVHLQNILNKLTGK